MKNKLTVLSGIMLTATLLLTGRGSKKLDIDNKETSLKDETSVSTENNTTTQSNEEMPEGGYKYSSESGSAGLFAYELKDGKRIFEKKSVVYISQYGIDKIGNGIYLDQEDGKNYIVNFL